MKNMPVCPICGAEAQTFYRDSFGETFGCDECVVKVDWTEVTEEEEIYAGDAYVDHLIDEIIESRMGVL